MTPEEIKAINETLKTVLPVLGTLLGAVIGSVTTYALTKINYKQQIELEGIKQKNDIIVDSANKISRMKGLVRKYLAALHNKRRNLDFDAMEFIEIKRKLVDETETMHQAKTQLMISGMHQAADMIKEIFEPFHEVWAREKSSSEYFNFEKICEHMEAKEKLFCDKIIMEHPITKQ